MQQFVKVTRDLLPVANVNTTSICPLYINTKFIGAINSTANTNVVLRIIASQDTFDTYTIALSPGSDASRDFIISSFLLASTAASNTGASPFLLNSLPTAATLTVALA